MEQNDNNYVNSILSGINSTNSFDDIIDIDCSDWMSNCIELFGNAKLKELCISGSHDSGMSLRVSGTLLSNDNNTLTQTKSIKKQLEFGVRYFDVRPVIAFDKFTTGHYHKLFNITWQGSNGQSIESIISDINQFVSKRKELIIINLSHTLNTDVGNSKYRPLLQNEWEHLILELMNINCLYKTKLREKPYDLSELKLNDFIAESSSVVIIIEDDYVNIGKHEGNGFYKNNSFNVYNKYSKTKKIEFMISDQKEKLRNFNRKSSESNENSSKLFLLSWTLTHLATTNKYNIINMANIANQRLFTDLYPLINSEYYPNIIYTDNTIDCSIAALSIAINCKLLFYTRETK